MREPAHALTRPLPPDVAAGESAVIRFYQQYTVFSWPWAWRRTVLFGSLGMFLGAIFGASHGLYVRSVGEGMAVSMACGLANVVLVGAGPMIAAFFRHRGWPLRVERALIVAAVIAGVFLGGWADDLAAQYHDHFMALHGSRGSPGMQPKADLHLFVRRVLDLSKDLLILFIASGGLALPVYFSEKKRWAEHWRRVELEKISAQKSESDLRLTVLQAQVEPHFLFNTLASVRSLVTSDPQRAAQTIDALAQHLRATLPKIRAQTGLSQSTLGEQFDICASYLELMKVRLGERLQAELRLPPELRELPFPPLLLISLVENAIKHGAEPKPGVTRVTLVARVENDRLEVTVEDDGAGLTLGMGEGTGLANIRAQLLTRFGTAAQLELLERAYGGVIARLVTPLEPRPA
ncbi:MAG TPA: histidine kinase [Steroidobacteraceae bacterium]